jgi:hypothetical protein
MRLAAALTVLLLGCAGGSPPSGDDYLRYTAFDNGFNEHILMRWPDQRMPLKVHLPAPPSGMVEDPEAVLEAVRDGFTDWTDAGGPGVPSFVFVEEAGAADIPVVWEAAPNGEWYIAHCAYDIDYRPVRFGVSRILITTEWQGATWSLEDSTRPCCTRSDTRSGCGTARTGPTSCSPERPTRAASRSAIARRSAASTRSRSATAWPARAPPTAERQLRESSSISSIGFSARTRIGSGTWTCGSRSRRQV